MVGGRGAGPGIAMFCILGGWGSAAVASGQPSSGDGLLEVQGSCLHLHGGEQRACGHLVLATCECIVPEETMGLGHQHREGSRSGLGGTQGHGCSCRALEPGAQRSGGGLAGVRMGTWGSLNSAVPLGTF